MRKNKYKKFERLFYFFKNAGYFKILYAIYVYKGSNKSQIAIKSKMTYSYVFKLIKNLEDMGLVYQDYKDKRSYNLKLTKRGFTIARFIENFVEFLDNSEEEE